MEDNTTNNTGAESSGPQWKATIGRPSESPWASTSQKDAAWEGLHARLQGALARAGAPAGLAESSVAPAQREPGIASAQRVGPRRLKLIFIPAAILMGIALITGIRIALKNTSTNPTQKVSSKSPLTSDTVLNQGAGSSGGASITVSQSEPRKSQTSASPFAANGAREASNHTEMHISVQKDAVGTQWVNSRTEPIHGTNPDKGTDEEELATPPPTNPIAQKDISVMAPATPAQPVSKVTVPHTALKVVPVNELEGTQEDPAIEKDPKYNHTLQIQWLHQGPHAEVSYQNDKTPTTAIQIKVH